MSHNFRNKRQNDTFIGYIVVNIAEKMHWNTICKRVGVSLNLIKFLKNESYDL